MKKKKKLCKKTCTHLIGMDCGPCCYYCKKIGHCNGQCSIGYDKWEKK